MRQHLVAAAILLAATAAGAEPRVASEPTVRETPREFLDSLSDNAIAPDPTRLYRIDGARREIGLGGGVTASLDERPPTRFDSPVALPGQAAAPSRIIGLELRRPGLFGDVMHTRSSVARDNGAGLRWDLFDAASLIADLHDQRSALAQVDARRRDSAIGLRWPAGAASWLEAGIHRASIAPASGIVTPESPEGSATFLRTRARWQPDAAPGLTLGVAAERALSRPAGPLAGGRLEFGADYTLQADNPLGAYAAGTRLVWREAPKLGLLSEGAALQASAAFKRTIGIEVPDGSPGGVLYSQWRSRSVASDDDSIWVLGWRHAWRPAPRWLLQSHVEQATPLAGPNAVRSFSVGGRLWRGAFPNNTFVTDFEAVNSQRDDSVYAGIKYTVRLGDHLLSALRLNASHTQPHGTPDAGTTAYKASAALGWREPIDQRLSLLGRWTVAGTEASEVGALDRRAHIALLGGNYDLGAADSASARWSQRWERDEARPELHPRRTTLAMARWVHDFADTRWSASAHVARRNDDLDGNAGGIGAELGYQLSRKAVLAFGYNPRGFSDHELEVDERLGKGFTLRLRFSINAALGRWFDAAPQ